MAAAVERGWKSLWATLQRSLKLKDPDTDEATAATQCVLEELAALLDAPIPQPAWKKLVYEHKVCGQTSGMSHHDMRWRLQGVVMLLLMLFLYWHCLGAGWSVVHKGVTVAHCFPGRACNSSFESEPSSS